MASADTITALCQVIQHELPSAIESVTLDLERARMEREDFRQGFAPIWKLEHATSNVSWLKLRRYLHDEIWELRAALMRVRVLVDSEPRMPKRRKLYVDRVIGRAIDSDEE